MEGGAELPVLPHPPNALEHRLAMVFEHVVAVIFSLLLAIPHDKITSHSNTIGDLLPPLRYFILYYPLGQSLGRLLVAMIAAALENRKLAALLVLLAVLAQAGAPSSPYK